jgi:hypothetical protein
MYSEKRIVTRAWAVSQSIGDAAHYFRAPASGFVYDVALETTTTWAGATNQLIAEVGTAADPDLYAELRSGTDAAATAKSARHLGTTDVSIIHETTNKFNKGDLVKITITAPAGGGAAGVGILQVDFALEA